MIGFDAVKHLVLCRIEKRPPRLNLLAHPYLPRAEVATTSARSYMGLEGGSAMSDTPQLLLAHHLKALKLPTFLREYDKQARQSLPRASIMCVLVRLTELELIDRERRMVERRIRMAKFPAVKSLDSFDFKAMPSLNKMMVLELARCEYIERRENVIALGNSGTGKTQPSASVGGCQRRLYHVWSSSSSQREAVAVPEAVLAMSSASCRLAKPPSCCSKPTLRRRSTLVTSNLPFDEWTEVFGPSA